MGAMTPKKDLHFHGLKITHKGEFTQLDTSTSQNTVMILPISEAFRLASCTSWWQRF